MGSPTILVLPGGGYSELSEFEAEPIAEWLRGAGWDARVVRYPVQTRHPGPLRFVQEQIAAERDRGASSVMSSALAHRSRCLMSSQPSRV